MSSSREAKKRRRKRYGASMKVTRRLHMYFGLVLTPFVLLYGVTAIFFNHPTLLTDRYKEVVDDSVLASVEFPDADQFARQILESINESAGVPIAFAEGERARFKNACIIDVNTEEERSRYRLYAPGLSGSATRTPLSPDEEPEDPPPFPVSIGAPGAELIDAISATLSERNGAPGATVRRAPTVEFRAQADGESWLVSCDLRTGAVSARPVGQPTRDVEIRSFLTRLHVSRGYPHQGWAKTVWAVLVDVTAVLMIFWAVSGVLMSWQLRTTRKSAALAAAAGILGAAILGSAMFQIFYY